MFYIEFLFVFIKEKTIVRPIIFKTSIYNFPVVCKMAYWVIYFRFHYSLKEEIVTTTMTKVIVIIIFMGYFVCWALCILSRLILIITPHCVGVIFFIL